MRNAASRIPAAIVVVAAVTAGVTAAITSGGDAGWRRPAASDVPGVKVVDATLRHVAPVRDGHAFRGPQRVQWPTSGERIVDLTAPSASSSAEAFVQPSGPRTVVSAQRGSAATAPSRLAVDVLSQATTTRARVAGVLMTMRRADGRTVAGPVTMSLDYSGFGAAYGGDWASRLRFTALPNCATTTPDHPRCQRSRPVTSINDKRTHTLFATLNASSSVLTLAATASPSGDNGNFAATSLSQAGSWQVSTQSGAFSWSLPVKVPPAPGGPVPDLRMSYASSNVDGLTGFTNNQGGWVGDGWDLWPGFIERTYTSCADDDDTHKTGDRCWFSDNATLAMNGHAGELIKDGDVWRLKDDDGTRVERVNGVGDQLSDGTRSQEYWKVTTPDGVQYYFGYDKLPGWQSGDAQTDSVWSVPVVGNDAGEPCHDTTFASSSCSQPWRWNLDYVVDPHSNSMAYYYHSERGAYGRDMDPSQRTTYDRGGYLDHVDYGMRKGSEYGQNAPLRVDFATAERCLSGCWTGAAWTSDPVTSAWPDTPWDQYCSAEPCSEQPSPTFWSARRLTAITTRIRNGSGGYDDVDTLALRQVFDNAGTGETTPLWLAGVTHTGHVTSAAGSAVTMPETVFDHGSEPLANRVDGPSDNRTALARWRIKAIHTESGGQIVVTYSAPDCTRSTLPTPSNNHTRCMPAFYSWPGSGDPTIDWFNKYVVTRVDLHDAATDQLNTTTYYDYLDAPAWHYTDDEMTRPKYKTWGQWRGYGHVRVRQGDPSSGATTSVVESYYLRGMDGDHGATDPVTVTDWAGSIRDTDELQGFLRQIVKTNGLNGTEVVSTVNSPWRHGPTATRTRNGVTTEAWMVQVGTARTRTALAAGGYRITRTVADFDGLGRPISMQDDGDEAVTGDETCARTHYAGNTTTWLMSLVNQSETTSGTCDQAVTSSNVLSRTRTFYDDTDSWNADPTKGDAVRTEALDSWSGTTPNYVTTGRAAFDANGRVTDEYDANGNRTHTTYISANSGLVVGVATTNAKSQTTSTTLEPAWGQPTKVVDPNGASTTVTYDGLGRTTAAWWPNRNPANTPSVKFAYLIRASGGANAVTTDTLVPTGVDYRRSINLYDGFLRLRQVQTQATDGGRTIAETFYNTAGQVDWTSAPYYDNTNAAPSTTLGSPQGSIPSVTKNVYDGAGRQTASVFQAFGVEKWRTSTVYGGDRETVTPPAGAAKTTTVVDAHGRPVTSMQYNGTAHVDTMYAYDLSGQVRTIKHGNDIWTYSYDLRGRKTKQVDPDTGTTTYGYDPNGNLTSTTDNRKLTLAYTYDELGRRLTVRDGSSTGSVRAEWKYDSTAIANGIGRPYETVRHDGSDQYVSDINGYTVDGSPTGTSLTLPASAGALCAAGGTTPCTYTNAMTYRPDGSLLTRTLPAAGDLTAAEKLQFGYNYEGLPIGVFSPGQGYVETAYDKLGEPITLTYGNYGKRVAVTSTYDEPTRRLTSTNVVPELKSEAADWAYSYNNAGDVTRIADTPQNQTADYQCFAYDYLEQLTTAWTPTSGTCTTATQTVASLGGPAKYWKNYTYDAAGLGNRTSVTTHATVSTGTDTKDTYAYPTTGYLASGVGGPDAVKSTARSTKVSTATTWTVGATSAYTYDAAGNADGRPSSQNLDFDAEGRVHSVAQTGKPTQTYVYDADGAELLRKGSDGSRELFLPDGTRVTVAAGATAAKAVRYYTSGSGVRVAMRSAAGLTWLVTDPHGTANLTIDAATLAVTTRRSDPFGNLRSNPSAWPAFDDKGFVGGTKEPDGLTTLGAREYDPALGRFVSVDPVLNASDPQSLGGYGYASNNPVTSSDPSGLCPPDKCGAGISNGGHISHEGPAEPGNSFAGWYQQASPGLALQWYVPPAEAQHRVVRSIGKELTRHFNKGMTLGQLGNSVGGLVESVSYAVTHPIDTTEALVNDTLGDIYDCLGSNSSVSSCVSAVLTVLPASKLLKLGKAVKDARNLKREEEAANDANRARRAAACGANSFSADTNVVMADGTPKPLDRVKVGDKVEATNPTTGKTAAETVTKVWVHHDSDLLDVTITARGKAAVIHATQHHPFWDETRHAWTVASKLRPGDRLRTDDGATATVAATRVVLGAADMWDLTVQTTHDFYVATEVANLLVHNCDLGHAGIHQYPGLKAGKSQFYDDEDLARLSSTDHAAGVLQRNGNTRYVLRGAQEVGVDRTTGLPTDVYTVIRKPDGSLLTMFPGTSPLS